MRSLPILAIALCATAAAGDREFDAIVRAVESRYETPPARIPFFGVANFFVKVARPAGTSDLKLAVFEDLRRPMFGEEEQFTTLVRDALGPEWHPFLRVHSRQDNQWTCMYSSSSGGAWKLLLASLQRNEATVIRLRVNPKGMMNWVEKPRDHMRMRTGD